MLLRTLTENTTSCIFVYYTSHIILNEANTKIGEGTLPWAIFRFRIFSNYFSQKFEKNKNNGLKE